MDQTKLIFLILVIANLLIPQESAVSQPFGMQNVLCSGSITYADQVEIDDLNMDNLPDVITSSDLGLYWFENTGTGNFNFQQTLFMQYPGCDFALSDFNADNYPDLLIAQKDSNTLCWSRNNGAGAFDSVIMINNDSVAPQYVVVCDLDMDGTEDFLVSYSPYNHSVWYHNDGEGNFTQAEINAVPYSGKVTGTWDFDSDGDPDILVHNNTGLQLLENNGDGIFVQLYQLVDYLVIDNQWTGDLDNDGDEDLILYDPYDDEVFWLENNGSMTGLTIHSIGTQYNLKSVCLSDFDLDNDLDLITGTYNNGFTVYENLGTGVFDEAFQLFDECIVPAIGADDMDQDGYPDLVILYGQNTWSICDQAAWFKSLGELVFEDPEPLTSVAYQPVNVVAADLNGDNEKDILAVSSGDNKIGWFKNIGYQCYAPYELINDTLINAWGCMTNSGVLADDLDLDGDIDLIAYSCRTYVLLNDGSGMFSIAFSFGFNLREVSDICLEDLNDDGFKDIVAATYDGILAYRNNGDGSFIYIYSLPVNWPFNSATTGDIDGDGDPDIIFGIPYYEKIGYILNDGTGAFSDFNYITELEPSYHFHNVRAADLDDDSDLDIMACFDYKIVWYEHQNGNWGDEVVIVPSGVTDYCLTDLDDDDDQDIVYSFGPQILWKANDGSGHFSGENVITSEALGGSCVFNYDIDNDSDLDIFSASFDEDKVAWYENLRTSVTYPETNPPHDPVKVFPVPTKDIVNVGCGSGNINKINVSDITGKYIIRINTPSEKDMINVDLSKLNPGIYLIEVNFDDGSHFIRKIIKR